MTFSVIYPHTAFTSLGANKVKPRTLQAEVLAQPSITTVLDRIRVDNPGSGSVPEVDDPTGRTWAFIFNGSGPLSGPETTALNAIVAAHTGIEAVAPSSITLSDGIICTVGTIAVGEVMSRTGANAVSGVAAGGGSGDVTAAAAFGNDNRIVTSDGAAKGVQASAVTLDAGNISGVSQLEITTGFTTATPAIGITTNSGSTKILVGAGGSPITTSAPGGAVQLGVGAFSLGGGSSPAIAIRWPGSTDNGPWAPVLGGRPCLSNSIVGLTLTYVSTTSFQVSTGSAFVSDAATGDARVATLISPVTISTATSGLAGLDTGSITTNRWYYVWLVAKNSNNSDGHDVSAIMSLSATTPTMPAGYTMRRRIGCVRTASAATSILEFYQTGTSTERTYIHDSLTEFVAVSGGAAVSATSIGHSAGAGSLPSTANFVGVEVTTNSTAIARIRPNSGISVNLVECPLTQTKRQYVFPISGGVFQYINSTSGGSTAIAVHWFRETL